MIPTKWLDTERGQTPSEGVEVLGWSPERGYCLCRRLSEDGLLCPIGGSPPVRWWTDLPEPPAAVGELRER